MVTEGMSYDKDDQESASGGNRRPQLHLVAQSEKVKSGASLPEAATTELREMIQSLQEKNLRGTSKPSQEDLPPAA